MIKGIFTRIIALKTSETKQNKTTVLERLSEELLSFKVVFDVGAYHGEFVDEILKLNANIKLHCFEPSAESHQFLLNKFYHSGNVKIINCAVSDFTGSANININAFEETNSLLESVPVSASIDSLTQKVHVERVEVIKLCDYCLNNDVIEIDLIKIDTQGNSYNVLKVLEPFLKLKKIKYLYVEAEFVEIYKNEKLFSEIEVLMRSFGYSIFGLYNLNYLDNQQLAWCDVLFAPSNL